MRAMDVIVVVDEKPTVLASSSLASCSSLLWQPLSVLRFAENVALVKVSHYNEYEYEYEDEYGCEMTVNIM